MARITGTIGFDDVKNLDLSELNTLLENKHRQLNQINGFGQFTYHQNHNHGIDWQFDYAEGFNADVIQATLGGHRVEPMTPELLDAMFVARVKLCNCGSVVFRDGQYHPLNENDSISATVATSANVLEEVLTRHGRGTVAAG